MQNRCLWALIVGLAFLSSSTTAGATKSFMDLDSVPPPPLEIKPITGQNLTGVGIHYDDIGLDMIRILGAQESGPYSVLGLKTGPDNSLPGIGDPIFYNSVPHVLTALPIKQPSSESLMN